MSFVHLHNHSQYSLLEATCTAKGLTQTAAEYGMPAVALTDNGNMFGAVEFYFAAKKAGVKPLIGLEVYIAPTSRHEKTTDRDGVRIPNRRLVLLAQNHKGYQNLCQISTIGYKEGFYYKPRIDYEVLKDYSSDVIALSGGKLGEVPWTFLNKGADEALKLIRDFKEIYDDRFYLELNRTGVKEWDDLNPFLLDAAKTTGTPVIAANDVHYLKQEDQIAQEVLICIGTNKTLQDDSRLRLGTDQFYFKSSEEMQQLFSDLPEACERTLEVAERCQVEFQLEDETGKTIYHLPTYPTAEGVGLKEEMRRITEEGLKKRIEQMLESGESFSDEEQKVYDERLSYELQIIDEMGFNGYFLIVQDFINWAKLDGIPVGPGRGSGAGSLVAFSLGITDLNPIPNKLIFERFLNPERISMPDFDIDFCQDRRQEVIEYVTKKYGEDSVSQIITYGKLKAKAAIRDVGRVLAMTYSEVDVISKLIPDELNITLSDALEKEPRIREQMEMDPQVDNLLNLAQKIEGLVRHAGIHAAGVVIADGRLVNHAPLYRGNEDENVIQYDMKHAEKMGLIKFDFLGLKTLTHVNEALKLIEQNRNEKKTVNSISLKDPGIYEIISKGDTAGIFQFEGDGISETIRKIKPTCFEDITAINALYRPGPMNMIPEYAKRKHGEAKISYLFPELEEILQETYGVIVYQEQVQLIAARIANYSLGEADMLRRAMGKKIPEEMEKQRSRFMSGAETNGHDAKKAKELFELMYKFAEYGFNKSHAAAYCVISAQTAWLKHYYPVEFFAALLSTEMNSTDKVVKYVKDARNHGINVEPPNINVSDYKFSVKGDTIYFSLGAIKGVGQSAVEALIEARAAHPKKAFESLEDFFENIDLRRVNKKVIECLIKSGALDHFGANRAELLHGYPQYLERAESNRRDREVGQTSLFSLVDSSESEIVLEKRAPLNRTARLGFEKETLGFYLSDHPLNGYENLFKHWTAGTIEDNLKRGADLGKTRVKTVLAGLVEGLREFITKKGTRMAFAQLEDLKDQIEISFGPDVYSRYEPMIKLDKPVLLTGSLENKEGSVRVYVEQVMLVEDKVKTLQKLHLRITPEMGKEVTELQKVLKEHSGPAQVTLRVELPEIKKVACMDVCDPEGVAPSGEFFEALQSRFGRTDFVELGG